MTVRITVMAIYTVVTVLGMTLNCIGQSYICCHHYVGH